MILFEWRWKFKWHVISLRKSRFFFSFLFLLSLVNDGKVCCLESGMPKIILPWRPDSSGLVFLWLSQSSPESMLLLVPTSHSSSLPPLPSFHLPSSSPSPRTNHETLLAETNWGGWSGRSGWHQYQAGIASWICRWWRAHPGSGQSSLTWFPLGCRAYCCIHSPCCLPSLAGWSSPTGWSSGFSMGGSSFLTFLRPSSRECCFCHRPHFRCYLWLSLYTCISCS